jgi:serine phosphatase RsbU (regulator of sigma subunit)
MAVKPDRRQRAELDPAALEALADAGRAAARGARLGEVLEAVVAASAAAAGAEVAVARVADAARRELVARAVSAPSAALVVELSGDRMPIEELSADQMELDEAPDAVRAVARRIGAEACLVVPVVAGEDVVGSLELLRTEGAFSSAERVAARLAATQLGLAIRAFDRPVVEEPAVADAESLRVVGEALAAGADPAQTASQVLRLALEASGAAAAALWVESDNGGLALDSSIGTIGDPEGARTAAAVEGPTEIADGVAVTVRAGNPPLALLQLIFSPDDVPDSAGLERLEAFALRASHALRSGDRARRMAEELEQTRALLSVAGQASAELSLAHALDTAVERVAELARADRLAVYLLEGDRLAVAAQRGLAGPHLRVAEELLELALGPFRGRGMVVLSDAGAEPRLVRVGNSVSEAGIEAAIGLPLLVGEEVIGLLAAYPPRGRTVEPSEATLFGALAGQLAVAVQNARLHERATRLGTELEQALDSERQAARRLGALYEISRSFAQSLSLDVTLEALARTVVELLDVDAASLRMPDHRRAQLVPHALHVNDEQVRAPLRALMFRPQPFGLPAIQRLFRERVPIVLDPVSAAELGGPHALLRPFLEKGSTVAIVPIATPTEVLGALTLISLRSDRPIDTATIDTAIAIGGQAALAIDNARLYQQQKDFADAMQRSLLPQVRPAVVGLDIGEVYAPSARVDVGGDLYDYIALPDGRLAVVVGDVTGHGIDAAADMAMAKFVFRTLAREHPEPRDFLATANDVVVDEIAPGKFITMLYLVIDPRTGRIGCASAGHPPPRLIDAAGRVGEINARGLALGVEPGVEYEEVRAHLAHDGAVVLYTDGVIEARHEKELYGLERLDALLARRHALRAEDVAASVIESARRFTGGELFDDCAVVVLKRAP